MTQPTTPQERYQRAVKAADETALLFAELAQRTEQLAKDLGVAAARTYLDPDDPDQWLQPGVLASVTPDTRNYREMLDRLTVHLHGHHAAWAAEARTLINASKGAEND